LNSWISKIQLNLLYFSVVFKDNLIRTTFFSYLMMTLRVFLICSIGLVFTNSLESHPVHHIDPVDNDAYPHLNRRGLLKSSDEPRNVIVILKDRSVSEVRASLKRKTHLDETKAIVNNLKRKQDALVGEMEMRGGKVIQQYQHALNGIRIHITQDNEQRLKGHPDVADILPLRTFQRRNVESVPFLGVPQIWNLAPLGIGLHGEGIKVGIIDTGIDYTHANFGGPGTVDAYNVAMAGSNQTANAAMFGPSSPKVKGGYDFAGDNYDGTNTPTPDSNPLDCQGHGSHVAGTVGGFGVMSDGYYLYGIVR
jgi:minor extracellular serine protease Vpr